MVKKLVLVFCFFILSGCSTKRYTVKMAPVPEAGTREALLPTYQPSGSPCLDSIIVNLLYSGCSEIALATDAPPLGFDEPITFMGCTSPQPGAMDQFSNYTFVRIPHGLMWPEDIMPYCGDEQGMYGYITANIHSIVENE
ncbi:MAG TPA: hypothetical protein EYQ00_03790 [Dehalococcoidia bacterium]|jgi:uncharacterized protein YceK|nr:hypothetical protein [Dehalococcoidia bacterium]